MVEKIKSTLTTTHFIFKHAKKNFRLAWLVFQIRVIERKIGVDVFFLSPRRLIATLFEVLNTHHPSSITLKPYGNYLLAPSSIPTNPIVYSGGVGSNISFDCAVLEKHGGLVRLFDPTPASIDFIQETDLKENMHFYPWALYSEDKKVRIYFDPTQLVKSASITNFLDFDENTFFDATARKIPSLMQEFNDTKIDILKLDIEGVAEDVLEDIFNHNITPKQIVCAFEVPINYKRALFFLIRLKKIFKLLKGRGYTLYRVRDRSRGVELEILAIYNR